MITIIDYGLGNVRAFFNLYQRLNISVRAGKTADELKGATKLILPGVGAFDHAVQKFNRSGMRDAVEKLVLVQRVPILGICVGMQMLARSSEEGRLPGLGWIAGEVRIIKRGQARKVSLPHMGWNDVNPQCSNGLFRNLQSGARFYFLHSYYFQTKNQDNVLALTDYNGPFASAVCSGNVYGVQFHPEKSHQWGIQLLKNFAEL